MTEAKNKLDLLHMSLEKRMAETNPKAAQVGIYNEKQSPKATPRTKPPAVTGMLEVISEENCPGTPSLSDPFPPFLKL